MGVYSGINENTRNTGQVTCSDTLNGPSLLFRLEAGPTNLYRLAQMDDYSRLPRGKLLYRPPVSLCLEARVSDRTLPGTWGFGFWNDPFALGIGIKGSGFRLPALPETAWFFFGSAKNDLSVSSDTPANGLMASVFTSTRIPPLLLPAALPLLPFLWVKPASRHLRRMASHFIHDEFKRLTIDPTGWHSYRLDWLPDSVVFHVDEQVISIISVAPRAPLGLVVWIDNQYAAFSADGSVHAGTEANPVPAWMEIRDMSISPTGN